MTTLTIKINSSTCFNCVFTCTRAYICWSSACSTL